MYSATFNPSILNRFQFYFKIWYVKCPSVALVKRHYNQSFSSSSSSSSSSRLSLHFNGHFPGGPGLVDTRMSPICDVIGAKDDAGGGDNWSYKTCKAPVKSSSPTSQRPSYGRPDTLPMAQTTESDHWRETEVLSLQSIYLTMAT